MSFVTKLKNFLKIFQRQKLSSQISISYALILLVTIFFINVGTTAGVYYLFYHQAERSLDISIERVEEKIKNVTEIDKNFLYSGVLMSTVILRVTDDSGAVVLDNSPGFPALEKILILQKNNSPFWSSEKYKLIETPNSFFYYKNLPVEVGGKIFYFHFFRTITFEKNLIRNMLWIILIAELIGISFAIKFGNIFSKKILKPLQQVTATAREISAENLDARIEIKNSAEEVREVAENFNKMLDRLEKNFKQQQRFISDASHEFRTPITIIQGYTEMLESYGAEDSEIFAESVTEIKKSAQDMQTLIEKLLFLARADQNNLPTKKLPVEINNLLQEVIKNFSDKQIEIICEENFEVIGDEDFLKKMFSEFIENAFKYGGKKIIVQFDKKISAVKIIDDGIGIAPENLDKIFDRFYRADSSRTKTDSEKISAGLGLSIAKWIADRHGIKIEIVSALGKGTTVICKFPQ